MGETHPRLREEARQRLQILKLGVKWYEQFSCLETPDQVLQREINRVKSGWKDAQAKARACVGKDPQSLVKFDKALEDAFAFHAELKHLERSCDCAARERQDAYERQYADLMHSFPFQEHLIPGDPSSASPTLKARITTEPTQETRLSTSDSESNPSPTLLSLEFGESDLNRAGTAELEGRATELGAASETALSPEEVITHITVLGDDTELDEVVELSGSNAATVS